MARDSLHLSLSVRSLVPDPDISGAERESRERVHALVQSKLRRKYRTFHAEVTLSTMVETSRGQVEVHGRMDGYRVTSRGVLLYEIKPVPGSAKACLHSDLLQSARWQLQLYLELAQLTRNPPWGARRVVGGVLYLVGEDGRSADELVELPLKDLLTRRLEVVLADRAPVRHWSGVSSQALENFIRNDSRSDRALQQTAWPQLEGLHGKSEVLLSLPPGAGKTRLALRHAIRQGVALARPVFWITTKTRGRDIVLDELKRYLASGLSLRVLWKTSASRLCSCEGGTSCDKHARTLEYLFLNGLAFWNRRDDWTPDDLLQFADEHDLCAHELSRRLEPLADLIIADVNYLFERSTIQARDAITVFDEAQNLAARALDYSRVFIGHGELKTWLQSLPTSSRRRYRSLTAPDFSLGPDHLSSHELWGQLRRELETRSNLAPDAIQSIRRLAIMLERFPSDYILRWYHGPDAIGWLGTLPNAEPALIELFSRSESVLALSGSPSESFNQGVWQRFEVVTSGDGSQPPVAIVPLLDFAHPISLADHEQATELLRELHESQGSTVAVFGQNRASNELLAFRLRAHGFTSLLDSDVAEDDWEVLRSIAPDFLFISLGSNLSESVNPPADVFSCGVVLAAGHRPSDIFELAQRAAFADGEHEDELRVGYRTPEAVSRIVQAAGRLQRGPERMRPVFLLNKSFARADFLGLWPRSWYRRRPQELLFDNLESAHAQLRQGVYAH